MKTERFKDWWQGDNIVHPAHDKQIALIRMREPRVFILLRDEGEAYFTSFSRFCQLTELNFFDPEDRKFADTQAILEEAYDFLLAQEDEDERRCQEDERDW